jgi:hypothetical protein
MTRHFNVHRGTELQIHHRDKYAESVPRKRIETDEEMAQKRIKRRLAAFAYKSEIQEILKDDWSDM